MWPAGSLPASDCGGRVSCIRSSQFGPRKGRETVALPKGYAVRRDTLFARARDFIGRSPAAFAEAAAQLDRFYSEEQAKVRMPSLGELTGPRCLLGRINLARADALKTEPLWEEVEYFERFNFEDAGDPEQRRVAARRFILIILLSGDYHANEAIQSEWGEIVSLPWDTGPDKVLGREWCIWPRWDSGGGTADKNPSPEILDRLESAMAHLDQGQESEMASQNGTAEKTTSVPPSGDIGAGGRKRRPKRDVAQITADNDTIRQYLYKNPLATRDQIAEATGIARGHVSASRAWKGCRARRKEAREMKKASEHGIGGVGDPTTDLGRHDRDD